MRASRITGGKARPVSCRAMRAQPAMAEMRIVGEEERFNSPWRDGMSDDFRFFSTDIDGQGHGMDCGEEWWGTIVRRKDSGDTDVVFLIDEKKTATKGSTDVAAEPQTKKDAPIAD